MKTNQTVTSLVVIETYDENGNAEWGLSFDGHNPSQENYFEMINADEAFRLQEKLSAKFPPVTFDNVKKVTQLFTKEDYEIRNAIYSLFEIAFKDSNILSVIGSWKDTMSDEFILNELNNYIKDLS